MREITPIRIDEQGDETHESWLLISASKVQSSGTWLFDSDIRHGHFITVRVNRCTRKRQLHRDYYYNTKTLLEWAMSEAQWGAFVSSFGSGAGVPATLEFLIGQGQVPSAPHESRLTESHAEVRGAADKAMESVREAFAAYTEKKTAANLRSLQAAIDNAPSNMEFAASSLTEHMENVVTKARADIENMVRSAIEQGQLPASGSVLPGLPEHTEDDA